MPEQIEHIYGPSAEPYRIKLDRGQKGSYGWEISLAGNDTIAILERIKAQDKNLRETYGQGGV